MSNRIAEIDWSAVRHRVTRAPWAKGIVDSLSTAFDVVHKRWSGDPPVEQTEWTHHYFCDDDAAPLKFDFASPDRHVCTNCGKVYSGHPFDGAWRSNVHGSLVGTCERAAILARMRPEDRRYVAFLRRVILFYAEHYADYAVHGVRAGKGKIMSQSLDEAIVLITIGRCIEWGRDAGWFTEAELDLLRRKLFAPAAGLLKPQISSIHNIHQWLNSAVAACARLMGDRDLLAWTIESPTGFRAQLDKGTNADGFWFEGSITYHFYTFNALATHALTALDAGIDLFDDDPKFARMISAPIGLMYPNGTFPAHNDCWPGTAVPTELCEFAAWAWPRESFGEQLGWLYRARGPATGIARLTATVDRVDLPPTGHTRASVHALLWGRDDVNLDSPTPARQSRHFAASGISILEHPTLDLRLCLRAGPDGGMHDHRDKLSIDVFANGDPISPDLGTSGYGAKITGAWYRTAAAHNLVVIDGARQAAIDGEIECHDATRVVARAMGVTDGVNIRRTVELTDSGWRDLVEVEADHDVRADCFFHAVGTLTIDASSEPASLGEGSGYAWPRNVRSVTGKARVATWVTPAGVLRATLTDAADATVFTAEADDNPANPSRPLGLLGVRRSGSRLRFGVEYAFVPSRRNA